jgi:hypothetical protein
MIGRGLASTLGVILFDAFQHDPMRFSSNAPFLPSWQAPAYSGLMV